MYSYAQPPNKITILFMPFIFSLLLGCNENDVTEQSKPQNVPQSALWVGGIDGGVYIDITKVKTDPSDIFDATVYYHFGDIDYKGKLLLNSTNKAFDYKDVSSYSAWDGDTLYLQDGRKLTIHTTVAK